MSVFMLEFKLQSRLLHFLPSVKTSYKKTFIKLQILIENTTLTNFLSESKQRFTRQLTTIYVSISK